MGQRHHVTQCSPSPHTALSYLLTSLRAPGYPVRYPGNEYPITAAQRVDTSAVCYAHCFAILLVSPRLSWQIKPWAAIFMQRWTGHCAPHGNVDLDAYAIADCRKSAKILPLLQQDYWHRAVKCGHWAILRGYGPCWLCTDDDCVIVPTVRHHGLTLEKYACWTKTKSSSSSSSSSISSSSVLW